MKTYIIGAVVGISVAVAITSVWLLVTQNQRIVRLEVFANQVAALISQNQQVQK